MNAAAKVLVPEQWSFSYLLSTWVASPIQWAVTALTIAVFLSAIGVVYSKDLNRRLVGEIQMENHAHEELLNERSQLLLERSTWSTQARVQQLAQEKLEMAVPQPKHIVIVNEEAI